MLLRGPLLGSALTALRRALTLLRWALLRAALSTLHGALALLGPAGILGRTSLALGGRIGHPTTRLSRPRFLWLGGSWPALSGLAFDGTERTVFGAPLPGMTSSLASLRSRFVAEATGQTVLTAALFGSGDNFAGRTTCAGGISPRRLRRSFSRLGRGSGLLGGLCRTALCATGRCGDASCGQTCRGCATGKTAPSLGRGPGLGLHAMHLAALVLLPGISLLELIAQVYVPADGHNQGKDQCRDHPWEVLDHRICRGQQLCPSATCRGAGGH